MALKFLVGFWYVWTCKIKSTTGVLFCSYCNSFDLRVFHSSIFFAGNEIVSLFRFRYPEVCLNCSYCSRQKFTLPGTKVSPHVVRRRCCRRCRCRCRRRGQKVAKGLRHFPLSDQAEIQVCYRAWQNYCVNFFFY